MQKWKKKYDPFTKINPRKMQNFSFVGVITCFFVKFEINLPSSLF